MKKAILTLLAFGFLLVVPAADEAFAYQIQDLKDIPVFGDFVIGPTKHEIFLEPGQKAITELSVMNRLGRVMAFEVRTEDFTGSYDPEQTIILLGDKRGPYSLKDYLKPDITEFNLSHGQRITIPIEISIPEDAEPGGRYGSVLVNTNPPAVSPEPREGGAGTQIQVKTRIGSLFFVTVRGDVEKQGELKDFQLGGPEKSFYQGGPFDFEIFFENLGTTHLVPYGVIEIINMTGRKVGEIEVDPYFAMPDSMRARKVSWEGQPLFGKYTAALKLNRGYDNIVDEMSVDFWILPLRWLAMAFAAIVLIALLLKFIGSKFEIRMKGSGKYDVEKGP